MTTYLVHIDLERLADRLTRDNQPDQDVAGHDVGEWLKDEGFSAVRGGWMREGHPSAVLDRAEYELLDCYR